MRSLDEVNRLVDANYLELMAEGYCAIPERVVKQRLLMMYALGRDDPGVANVRGVEQLNPITREYIRGYRSLSQAAGAIGVSPSALCEAIDRGYTCGGFRFRYKDMTP